MREQTLANYINVAGHFLSEIKNCTSLPQCLTRSCCKGKLDFRTRNLFRHYQPGICIVVKVILRKLLCFKFQQVKDWFFSQFYITVLYIDIYIAPPTA